jgi:hypothetical protein
MTPAATGTTVRSARRRRINPKPKRTGTVNLRGHVLTKNRPAPPRGIGDMRRISDCRALWDVYSP